MQAVRAVKGTVDCVAVYSGGELLAALCSGHITSQDCQCGEHMVPLTGREAAAWIHLHEGSPLQHMDFIDGHGQGRRTFF